MNPENAELVKLRIANAKKTLGEVEEVLIENQLWNTAVNRLYYACFHAVTALLNKFGFETKTHSGVLTLFGLHFVKTGTIDRDLAKFYSTLFEMRQSADYEVEIDYEEKDVLQLIQPAKDLINRIEEILLRDDTPLFK